MTNPLAPGSLAGRVALVTGSSRGIGADTARYLAEAGAAVVINYRSKAPRAEKIVGRDRGGRRPRRSRSAPTSPTPHRSPRCSSARSPSSAPIDILVLNASGGMESGMGEDYAMRLNRDAQVNVRRRRAAAPRRGRPHRVRHEPPGALHPHDADDARVRARRPLASAPARTRCARSCPSSRRPASSSSSSPAT